MEGEKSEFWTEDVIIRAKSECSYFNEVENKIENT